MSSMRAGIKMKGIDAIMHPTLCLSWIVLDNISILRFAPYRRAVGWVAPSTQHLPIGFAAWPRRGVKYWVGEAPSRRRPDKRSAPGLRFATLRIPLGAAFGLGRCTY
jgi:hypothetical protein